MAALGKTEIVVLDKTGTITKGQPTVTDIIPSAGTDEEYLIKTALALEQRSEHPLARAVIKYGPYFLVRQWLPHFPRV